MFNEKIDFEQFLDQISPLSGNVSSTCLLLAYIEKEEKNRPEPVHIRLEFFRSPEEAAFRAQSRLQELKETCYAAQAELQTFGTCFSSEIDPDEAFYSLLHEQRVIVRIDPFCERVRKLREGGEETLQSFPFPFCSAELELDPYDEKNLCGDFQAMESERFRLMKPEKIRKARYMEENTGLEEKIEPYVFTLSAASPELDFDENSGEDKLWCALRQGESEGLRDEISMIRPRRARFRKPYVQ